MDDAHKAAATCDETTTLAPLPQAELPQQLQRRQQRMKFWRKLVLSFVLLLMIGAVFAIVMEVILVEEGQWSDLRNHRCTEYCENSHQCDHTMEERPTVQQPTNAYTNLAYIWCGLVPLVFLRVDVSTVMYFCASTLLAISSFMFHASVSSFWASMDGAYMFTYGAALIFHGFHVVFRVPWKYVLAPILVALFVAMPLIRPHMTIPLERINSPMFLVVTLLVATLVLARIYVIVTCQPKRNESDTCSTVCCDKTWQIAKIIGVSFVPAIFAGVATIVWVQDKDKEWCNPASGWQWHGVWHVLTAFASLWTWIFFDKHRLKDILSTSFPQVMEDDHDGDDDNYDNDVDNEQSGELCKERGRASTGITETFDLGDIE